MAGQESNPGFPRVIQEAQSILAEHQNTVEFSDILGVWRYKLLSKPISQTVDENTRLSGLIIPREKQPGHVMVWSNHVALVIQPSSGIKTDVQKYNDYTRPSSVPIDISRKHWMDIDELIDSMVNPGNAFKIRVVSRNDKGHPGDTDKIVGEAIRFSRKKMMEREEMLERSRRIYIDFFESSNDSA